MIFTHQAMVTYLNATEDGYILSEVDPAIQEQLEELTVMFIERNDGLSGNHCAMLESQSF